MDDTKYRYRHRSRDEMHPFVPSEAYRILDVGCHTGGFGEALKQSRTAEIWGIEPDSAAAEHARSCLDRVVCGYFDDSADIPDGYFDAITMNDVLEHMPDPWAALALVKRKLAPSGRLVLSLPNFRQIDNLLHVIVDGDFRYEKDGIRDSTHLRFFTRKSAIRLMEETGFVIERIEGIHAQWWSPSLIRRLAFRVFRKRLEDTRYVQFAIVARVRTDNDRAALQMPR